MTQGKHLYFASDFHLGIPNYAKSLEREKKLINWLDMAAINASKIFLMGDIFDFWYEYKKVVPKGYVRLQGKIASLCDAGIEVYFFKGNHDMWMFSYFQHELGVKLISDELEFTENGKSFYLHHGDGLGEGDYSYKFLKKIFRNPICIWLFGILPSRIGLGIAHYFSSKSRLANASSDEVYHGDSEWLLQFCNQKVKETSYDYMIFGHRHLPLDIDLDNGGKYINLGEWLHHYTYGVFDGDTLTLEKYN
ncbi:MAG: UDP-2,3-diacylglucosamine hydrolase [Bacteroidia bacterium]